MKNCFFILSKLSVNMQHDRRVKIYLFFFVLSVLILLSGARLVSSDEVSMYLTVESIVKHGTLALQDQNAPNSIIFNGKAYTWYEVGNILAGIPLYLIGYLTASLLPISNTLEVLLPRVAVSYTGAIVGAWIAILFFNLCKKFGLETRLSIGMALVLTFSTFLLPYYKMFLREPILTLCLLGGFSYLYSDKLRIPRRSLILAGSFIGFGILTKLVFVLNLVPFLFYIVWKKTETQNYRETFYQVLYFIIPIFLIGICGTGLYNYMRFGNPINMGYAGGTSFPIPFYVGMYGLILSPGKGILWFTPILFFLPNTIKHFQRKYPGETYTILGLFILNLILISMYIAWGGDGSWGPRYLAPFVPLFLLPIAFYLNSCKPFFKKIFYSLVVMGCLVQFGGISIYAGAYLRELGEYPYQRPFDDPEFLNKSHFIPNYTPIIGHWKMLNRNLGEHLRGDYPRLTIDDDTNNRLPIAVEGRGKLLHTLDFWFAYALYANISKKIIIAALVLITIVTAISSIMLCRAAFPLSN